MGLTPIKRPQWFIYNVESHDFTCSSADSDHYLFIRSGFFFHTDLIYFAPWQKVEWSEGLVWPNMLKKHKLGHAEKVKAGPVPFLPFSSSSSVLLQLSVEPWETETSNKEWVDRQTKRRRQPHRRVWMWVMCLDTQTTGWADDSLPGAQTSQDASIRAATGSNPRPGWSVQQVCKVFVIVSPRKYRETKAGATERLEFTLSV